MVSRTFLPKEIDFPFFKHTRTLWFYQTLKYFTRTELVIVERTRIRLDTLHCTTGIQ